MLSTLTRHSSGDEEHITKKKKQELTFHYIFQSDLGKCNVHTV